MFKTYDDVISFNQANIDALVQSSTKFATGVEEIAKEAFGFSGKAMEQALENVKALSVVKTPAEAIALQQKLAKDAWDSALAETNRLAEMGAVVSKSAMEPLQARAKATMDALKSAA